VIADKIVDY